jgi:hypothetical protein
VGRRWMFPNGFHGGTRRPPPSSSSSISAELSSPLTPSCPRRRAERCGREKGGRSRESRRRGGAPDFPPPEPASPRIPTAGLAGLMIVDKGGTEEE